VRVLLDTTYAARAPHSGTGVYLERLQDALAGLQDVELQTVADDRRRPPAGGGVGSLRNLMRDRWWTAVELPRLAESLRAEVIHHPLPAFARAARVPQVITVHDLAFERLPERFDRRFRLYAHRAHRAAARAARVVICVSETTATDVRELWGVRSERIVIAPHGPGQQLAPGCGEAGARRDAGGDHFLYVGDAEPRKNVPVLIAAYDRYREAADRPLPLVLAGAASAQGAGIRVERDPPRERLAELYAGAVALIHPSLYEGFGLTALEAMSAGTPVLAADVAGTREVCGEAARYANPDDPAAFAAAMAEIAEDPATRDRLAERGRRRAVQFSWSRCARAHVDAYSLALKRA
jgi:glycosyltransferase involved in cell wall biosynthesis